MDEYISREAVLEHLNKCKEDPLFDPDMARICFAISIFIENMKAADVISSAKVKDLQSQIADLKRYIKSLNSDYLTGYISALSAVQGMITKTLGE